MKVRVMFKGVTYGLLSDSAFLKTATKASLDLERFHIEIDAVPLSSAQFTVSALAPRADAALAIHQWQVDRQTSAAPAKLAAQRQTRRAENIQ